MKLHVSSTLIREAERRNAEFFSGPNFPSDFNYKGFPTWTMFPSVNAKVKKPFLPEK